MGVEDRMGRTDDKWLFRKHYSFLLKHRRFPETPMDGYIWLLTWSNNLVKFQYK